MEVQISENHYVNVAFVDDVEPNEGGYYCQVYDEDDYEIDNFVIHKEELPQDNWMAKEKLAQQIATNYILNTFK